MLGCAELSVQMVELGDELVDTLGDVLAPLVRFEELPLECAKLAPLLFQLASKTDVLIDLALVRANEVFDDTHQSFEVESLVPIRAGNDSPPRPGSYR